MNKKIFNYQAKGGCTFDLVHDCDGWYRVEMFTSLGETYLGNIQIKCQEDGEWPSFQFQGVAITTDVQIYTFQNNYYFSYSFPNDCSFDGLEEVNKFLDKIKAEAQMLQDLEEYVELVAGYLHQDLDQNLVDSNC